MKVLGIDPGTAVLGYGVVEGGPGVASRLVECGTLTTTPRDSLPARLRVIHDGMAALIARHVPDALAVESAFHGKNVRTTIVLSHARGVILLAAEEAGVLIAEYSPAQVKKAVVGRGAAMKPQVSYMVSSAPAPAIGAVAERCGGRGRRRTHASVGGLSPRDDAPANGDGAMIAYVSGVLAGREGDTIVVQTDGGVGYSITVPAGVAERLPATGGRISLHTELVVKEDGWSLFGFDRPAERFVFQRLLGASGFGPKLAIALLSALGPERTVRSILSRDLAALSSVGGIGRKKAERLVLELQDRFGGLTFESPAPRAGGTEDAVRALVGLGYGPVVAEDAVRAVLDDGAEPETPQLIRRALQQLASVRGGR